MRVRIKFSKHGVLKFLGHLDVMRYFQKAIRRAGIDIAYTGGFSPHQIMSFAAPLGVGHYSNGEYMDIEVNSHKGGADMQRRLQEVMAPGIDILSVTALPEGAGNAMASVAAAAYTIVWKSGYEAPTDLEQKVTGFLDRPTVPFLKKTKKNEILLDLKQSIYECRAGEGSIYVLADASSAGNISPVLFLEALYEYLHLPFDSVCVQITREDTYTRSGDQEALIPLDAAGEPF